MNDPQQEQNEVQADGVLRAMLKIASRVSTHFSSL